MDVYDHKEIILTVTNEFVIELPDFKQIYIKKLN